jgi:hypothetical protein
VHCTRHQLTINFIRRLSNDDDDDVLNEDWIKYRMVRSHRLFSLVLVAIFNDGSLVRAVGCGFSLIGRQRCNPRACASKLGTAAAQTRHSSANLVLQQRKLGTAAQTRYYSSANSVLTTAAQTRYSGANSVLQQRKLCAAAPHTLRDPLAVLGGLSTLRHKRLT